MAYRSKRTSRRRKGTSRKSRKKGGRRRRMGAVGVKRERITRLLATAAGAVVGPMIKKIPAISKLDSIYQNLIVAGVGVALPMLPVPMLKKQIVVNFLDGVAVAGAVGIVADTGVLNGIPIIAGWKDFATINGTKSAGKVVPIKTTPAREARNSVSEPPAFNPSTAQIMNSYYHGRTADRY